MLNINFSIKQSDVQNSTDFVSSQEEPPKKKMRSIFERSVSDVSEVTNEFVNNWVALVKSQLSPKDIKRLEIVYHEISIACNLPEKSKDEIYKEEILRAEVAKIAAAQNGTQVSAYIKNYQIKDQASLIEIAKIAVAQNGYGACQYIQNYGITDLRALVEIAKIIAEKSVYGMSLHIPKYGIKDQATLIEIAKIVAKNSGWEISNYIQKYGITDQSALIEIAKIAAEEDGNAVSKYIQNYRITDQSALVDIAKIAASGENGHEVSEFIQNYEITDLPGLVEIAKIAAAQNGTQVSEHIKNYEIKDQASLIEIAKIAVTQNGYGASQYIQNYEITDLAALVEIAKVLAEKSESVISEHIPKYGIKDQARLIEIAKIVAKNSGSEISNYIQNYGITDQATLIEIAKIAAEESGEGVSKYIQNYRITDQATLIEIAKIAAKKDGRGVSKYIQNYRITDLTALVDIAKIAAAENGHGVSEYIQNYWITDLASLIEIAKIAAAQNGCGLSEYIQNYEITDQSALIEIAKVAATQDKKRLSKYISNYEITDQIGLLHIFFTWARHQEVFNCQKFLIKKSETKLPYPSLLLFQNRNLTDLEMQVFINSIESPSLKEKGKALLSEENFLVKHETLRCLALVCLGCKIKEVSLSNQEKGKNLIEGLLTLRNPIMRRSLIGDVVETLKENTAMEKWKDLTAQSTANPKHALVLILIASLIKIEHYPKLGAILKHKDFKEIRRINVLLECLVILTRNKTLSSEEKESIATNLLFKGENPLPKTVYQNALMVLQCLSLEKDQEIKYLEDPAALLSILEREFINRFGLDSEKDFFTTFLRFQENFRNKEAIFTYAAAIERLPPHEKKLCKPVLQSYVQSILNGSFKEIRYKKETNPHLQQVFKDPALEELWKNGAEYSLKPFLHQYKRYLKQDQPVDFCAFFTQKIITDCHFPKDSIPYVTEVFKNCISLEESLAKIKEAIKNPENRNKIALLGIQEKILYLMKPGISLEDTMLILRNLINSLSRSNPGVELIHDLEGKLATLKALPIKQPEEYYTDWKIVDTDDPSLLLVLGSEVSESCQRVDGNPSLNKCLLDYLMNGKNRAFAVVNAKGKIQGRRILRLLWDKENSCPILFQERIYCHEQSPDWVEEVLDEACLKRAKELNLTLLGETPSEEMYPNPVYSLASVAPFEYVDAKETRITQGQWSLEGVFVQKEPVEFLV